jgi:hypothetical protein
MAINEEKLKRKSKKKKEGQQLFLESRSQKNLHGEVVVTFTTVSNVTFHIFSNI